MTARDFAALVSHPKKTATGFEARCPAHEDHRASLRFADGDKGLVLKCHAGCSHDTICAALKVPVASLFHANNGQGPWPARGHREIVASYDYAAGDGTLLFQVVRFDPKDFRQRRPDGAGGWTWKLDGVRRVLYRLPDLAEQTSVVWCEGEKDVDRLRALGIVATTSPGGADAFREGYAEQLADLGCRDLAILPDNDAPGLRYASAVAAAARTHKIAARIVRLPDLPAKGDVSDWLDAGHTVEDLRALLDAAPVGEDTPVEDADEGPAYLERIADFLREDDAPVDMIFPELLPAGVIMLAHGDARARKSLTAFELAMSAATGTAPFGLRRFQPAAPVPVLYVQEEDPRALTRPRLRRLLSERCGGAPLPETLHVAVRRGIDLDDPAWVARLTEDLTRLGARLLVLDAARRLSAKTDEGPAKVRELIAVLRGIVTATGVAIVIVHHDVKPPASGEDTRRRGHRASGGDWFAGSECPVHVEKVDERESVVYPQDYKFSADPTPFTFRTEFDGALIRCLVGQDSTTASAQTAGVRSRLLEWIRLNGPVAKTAMKKAGFGWQTIGVVLEGLLRSGLVDSKPGRTAKTHVFFVPGEPSPAAETPRGPETENDLFERGVEPSGTVGDGPEPSSRPTVREDGRRDGSRDCSKSGAHGSLASEPEPGADR